MLPVGGQLFASCTNLEAMLGVGNVYHCDYSPAEFIVVSLASLGMIKFIEGHAFAVIGGSNLYRCF